MLRSPVGELRTGDVAHLDAGQDWRLLSAVIRNPGRLTELDAAAMGRLIDAAWEARLLGWLLTRCEGAQARAGDPSWLTERLADVRAEATEADRAIRWEIDRIRRAFGGTDIGWVLLKGASYVAAGLPPGRGRQVADIDVLVPESQLEHAVQALQAQGWAFAELDPYDDRYYRQWAHELPPLVHEERRTVVDLHHGILPRTSRLHPPPARLIDRRTPTPMGDVLCPSHMVLHAAAHLFHDGEVAGAVRDLVDIDSLLRQFGADPDFWGDWLTEARALDLTRPAFYAVRYAERFAGTPIPPEVVRSMTSWGPSPPVLGMMDALVERTISGQAGAFTSFSAFALYVRSHWLRMPPLLLARHLTRKAFVRPA